MINWFGDVFLAEQSGRIEWPIGLFFWLVMGGSSRTATSQERRQAGHLISSFLPFSSIKSTKVEVDLIGLLNGNGAESEETNGKTTAPRASWLVVGYELPAPLAARQHIPSIHPFIDSIVPLAPRFSPSTKEREPNPFSFVGWEERS